MKRHHDERGEAYLAPRNKRFLAEVRRQMHAQGCDYATAFNSVMADPQMLERIDQGKPGQQFSNDDDLEAKLADSAAASKEFTRLVNDMRERLGLSYNFCWNRVAAQNPDLLKRMAKPSLDLGMMQTAPLQRQRPGGEQTAMKERPSTVTKVYPPRKTEKRGPVGGSRPQSLRYNPDKLQEFEHQT